MMSKNVLDRRVQKTRRLLQDALVALISEKGFEAVTIQEILDRANVGRSTFYFHFGNKYELMHSCFEDFCKLFEQHSTSDHGVDFAVSLLRLIEQNYRLFKAVLAMEGMPAINNPIHEYIFAYVKVAINKSLLNQKLNPIKTELLCHYISSALFGTLKWWVDNDMPCTVEEVINYFKEFTLYDISKIL